MSALGAHAEAGRLQALDNRLQTVETRSMSNAQSLASVWRELADDPSTVPSGFAPRPGAVAAATGCGGSPHFEGQAIPCGVLCSYGNRTLGNTFVLTSKPKGAIDKNNRLVTTVPDNMSNRVVTIQRKLNEALRTSIYRNTYVYQVIHHNIPYNAANEMVSMNVTDWSSQMSEGTLGEAFAEVRTACEATFGANNYTLTPFRQIMHYH